MIEPILNKIGIIINAWASRYKKLHRPKRIVIIRHGESQANIDPNIYDNTPDNLIELSELGLKQAFEAGFKLKELIKDETIKFYVSPFMRTRQTYQEIVKSFEASKYKIYFDPRLREQEWGNYQNQIELKEDFKAREKVGRFYYRFKTGESGADVYDRVSMFCETLFRDLDNFERDKFENIIIVSHGLFMRLFVMRYFKWTVEQFEEVWNPGNCEIWIMEKNENGSFELKTQINKKHI